VNEELVLTYAIGTRERPADMIPERIIHVYSPPAGCSAGLPLLYRAALANATLLNQEFEHVLFDRDKMEAFLKDEPASHQRAMRSFRFPIQRFDFFRYLAVYRLGGIYLDLDVILARSMEPLLQKGCIFPFEELTVSSYLRSEHGMDWELGNYAFGAEPGHPFIKAVIENCIRAQEDPSWAVSLMRGIPRVFWKEFFVVNTTGPGLVSRTFAENPGLRSRVTVLFPDDICDERVSHRFGDYGVHLMNASWRKQGGFVYVRLARYWEVWRRRRLLRESKKLGPSRTGNWNVEPCSSC
jgi:hypothetical protein